MSTLSVHTVRELRTLLARAYENDPLMAWIFPDAASRQDAIAAWLGLFVENYVVSGDIDTVGPEKVEAVAIWRKLDGPAAAATSALPTASGLLTALVGGEHAAAIGNGLARIREVTPQSPHAYLHFLAVDPGLQRRGLGGEVIAPGLRRAERAGLGVHLETTNTENLAFYQRLGFEVSESLRLSEGGPTLWAMWRAPRITGE